MCDFSLQSVRSRPAKVGDKLVTHDFGTGTAFSYHLVAAPTRIAGVPQGHAQHTRRRAVTGWRHKRRVWRGGKADCSCVFSGDRPCDKLLVVGGGPGLRAAQRAILRRIVSALNGGARL